jgi:hypothetical protein
MRVYEILPGKLYLSARTHQLDGTAIVNMITRYKISGIVNLWHSPDNRIIGLMDWYEQVSLPDGQMNPRMAMLLETLVTDAVAFIRGGGVLLAHCWGGRNRSGLFCALVLMQLEGITGADAYARVRAVRRGALVNEHFARYLTEGP